MKKIELEVRDSFNDKENIILKIDGKEVGILYFTVDQKIDFLRILRRGKDDVELIEPADFDDYDSEENVDVTE